MYPTISDILSSSSAMTLSGQPNPHADLSRPVKTVTLLSSFDITPQPDTLYLAFDEWSTVSEDDFILFLQRCQEQSAGGLFLSQKFYETAFTKPMTSFLAAAGTRFPQAPITLPVICVRFNGSGPELCNALLNQINNFLSQKLQTILAVNTTCAKKSLKNEGISSLVDYFKEIVGNPVAVYDENFECLVATDSFLQCGFKVKGTAEKIFLNNLYFTKQQVVLNAAKEKKALSFVYFPISFESQDRAYLAVFEQNNPLTKVDYWTMEIAATSILIEMKRRLAIRSIEEKNINSFIYDLIYQTNLKAEDIQKEAEILNILADSRYVCLLLELATENVVGMDEPTGNSLLAKTLQDKIVAFIRKYFQAGNRHHIIGNLGKSIVVIYECDHLSNATATNATNATNTTNATIDPAHKQNDGEFHLFLKKQCDTLIAELKAYYENCLLFIGVGNIVSGISAISGSYQKALTALRYGKTITPAGADFVVLYHDASILKLIGSIGSNEELSTIVPDRLKALLEYDQINHTQLYKTLSTYLHANCNAKQASEKLFIHYKTMLYRLERIAELFQFDLSDHDERLDLTLGIKILDILSKNEDSFDAGL